MKKNGSSTKHVKSDLAQAEAESIARFTAAAKEAGCDENEADFVEKLKVLASFPPGDAIGGEGSARSARQKQEAP